MGQVVLLRAVSKIERFLSMERQQLQTLEKDTTVAYPVYAERLEAFQLLVEGLNELVSVATGEALPLFEKMEKPSFETMPVPKETGYVFDRSRETDTPPVLDMTTVHSYVTLAETSFLSEQIERISNESSNRMTDALSEYSAETMVPIEQRDPDEAVRSLNELAQPVGIYARVTPDDETGHTPDDETGHTPEQDESSIPVTLTEEERATLAGDVQVKTSPFDILAEDDIDEDDDVDDEDNEDEFDEEPPYDEPPYMVDDTDVDPLPASDTVDPMTFIEPDVPEPTLTDSTPTEREGLTVTPASVTPPSHTPSYIPPVVRGFNYMHETAEGVQVDDDPTQIALIQTAIESEGSDALRPFDLQDVLKTSTIPQDTSVTSLVGDIGRMVRVSSTYREKPSRFIQEAKPEEAVQPKRQYERLKVQHEDVSSHDEPQTVNISDDDTI